MTINMKKILSAIFVAILSAGCANDKGSYDYHDINEVTISGVAGSYSVMTEVSVLHIEPTITCTMGDPDDLEYEWRATIDYNGSTLLGTERVLDYPVTLEPRDYSLYLRVKDPKTEVTAVNKSTLKVGTPYSRGILLSGEKADGKSDIQMLAMTTDTFLIDNMLQISGLPESTTVRNVLYTGKNNYKKLWIMAADDAYSVDLNTFKYDGTSTFEKILYPTESYSEKFVPVDIIPHIKDRDGNEGSGGYNRATICSDGHVFSSSLLMMGGEFYVDPVNRQQNTPDQWDKAHPNALYSLGRYNGLLYYDLTNERFCKVGSFDSYSSPLDDFEGDIFPWNQSKVGRTMVYAENTFNQDGGSGNGNSFALMKDKQGSQYYIYKIYVSNTITKIDFYTINPSIATDFERAKFYAFSGRRTTLFYTVDSKLYAYDYNKGNEKCYLLKDFGSDQISLMQFDTQIEPSDNPLYVATWNGTSGTLQKFRQDINPNVVTITADPKAFWTNLMKVKTMSWRAG